MKLTEVVSYQYAERYQQCSEETVKLTDNPEIPSQVPCSLVLKDDSSSTSVELVVGSPKLKNSDIMKKYQAEKLDHLDAGKQEEMIQLVFQFINLFSDTPS